MKNKSIILKAFMIFFYIVALSSAIEIHVLNSTDVVDFRVLNSNWNNCKIGIETNEHAIVSLKAATNAHQAAIASLINASNIHQIAIANLNTATGAQQIAIVALNASTNAQDKTIASLINASNIHQIAIAKLNTASNLHQSAITALNAATNSMNGFLVPVGTILQFGASAAPTGYLLCDGTSKDTNTYSTLYGVIGYTFGGSGASFSLPDLRKRVAVGPGTGYALGASGGYENVTLTIAQIPSHTHLIAFTSVGAISFPIYSPKIATYTTAGEMLNSLSPMPSGGGLSHSNMPPYLVINYIIKY